MYKLLPIISLLITVGILYSCGNRNSGEEETIQQEVSFYTDGEFDCNRAVDAYNDLLEECKRLLEETFESDMALKNEVENIQTKWMDLELRLENVPDNDLLQECVMQIEEKTFEFDEAMKQLAEKIDAEEDQLEVVE